LQMTGGHAGGHGIAHPAAQKQQEDHGDEQGTAHRWMIRWSYESSKEGFPAGRCGQPDQVVQTRINRHGRKRADRGAAAGERA